MKKIINFVNIPVCEKLSKEINNLFDHISIFHDRIIGMDVCLEMKGEAPVEYKQVGVRVFIKDQEIYEESKGGDDFYDLLYQVYHKIKKELVNLKDREKAFDLLKKYISPI